jgi:hypothetical protein
MRLRHLGLPGGSGTAGGISTASLPESSRGTATSETSGLGDVAPGLVTAGSSLEDAFSIAASFARKLISTRWASSVVNLFLSGNRRWTQSAASSAEWSPSSSTTRRGLNDMNGERCRDEIARFPILMPTARSALPHNHT